MGANVIQIVAEIRVGLISILKGFVLLFLRHPLFKNVCLGGSFKTAGNCLQYFFFFLFTYGSPLSIKDQEY